jgi:hypothetical protein
VKPKKDILMGYKSDNVELDYLSSLGVEEGEALIGKTIQRVEGHEYSVRIFFTDGTCFSAEGHTYGDCALHAELSTETETEES